MMRQTASGLYVPSDFAPSEQRKSIEDPSVPLTDFDQIADLFGADESDSGVQMSGRVALTYGPVWRAGNLLAGDVAKLPLVVYRRLAEGGKDRDPEHPAYYLLRYEPNEEMDAVTFWRTLMLHVLLWGNGYAYIDRDGAGRPIELLPLLPDRTEPLRIEGRLWYTTRVGHEVRPLRADQVLHIKGLGFDGLKGYSVVSYAKNCFGLGLAAEKFANKFYKNGARMSGLLTHPGRLTQSAAQNLQESFERDTAGLEKAHKVKVLEEGMKFQQLTIAPNEAQFIETRGYQVREVANWFGLPPHKLGDSSRTSYNSLEQENQAYLDQSLDPWNVTIEMECRRKLLSREEKRRDTHVVEYLRQAMVRANIAARYNAYKVGVDGGWLNADEVRDRENMNPIPDGKGKEFRVPLNTAPAGSQTPKPEDEDGDEAKRAAHRGLLADVMVRMRGIFDEGWRRHGGDAAAGAKFVVLHTERLTKALEPVLAVLRASYPLERTAATPAIVAELVGTRRDEQLDDQVDWIMSHFRGGNRDEA